MNRGARGFAETELLPRKLSREEMENPYLVIYDLFDWDRIPFLRNLLWEFLKAAITSKYYQHELNRQERFDLLIFYEKLEKLIEAVQIINSEKSDGKTTG